MPYQVDDALRARHVRYRAVPRTNRIPATSSPSLSTKDCSRREGRTLLGNQGGWLGSRPDRVQSALG